MIRNEKNELMSFQVQQNCKEINTQSKLPGNEKKIASGDERWTATISEDL